MMKNADQRKVRRLQYLEKLYASNRKKTIEGKRPHPMDIGYDNSEKQSVECFPEKRVNSFNSHRLYPTDTFVMHRDGYMAVQKKAQKYIEGRKLARIVGIVPAGNKNAVLPGKSPRPKRAAKT